MQFAPDDDDEMMMDMVVMMMNMRWTSMICTDSFACSPPAAIAASRLVLVVPERRQ